MPRRLQTKEALNGSLAGEVLRDLECAQRFADEMVESQRILFGTRLPASRLRDEILRLAVIEFGHGNAHNLAFYQRACVNIAGYSAIRDEIRLMISLGAFTGRPDPQDRRTLTLIPTDRLIDWCAAKMPRIVRCGTQ